MEAARHNYFTFVTNGVVQFSWEFY